MNKLCCNKQVETGRDGNNHAILCRTCEKYGTGKTIPDAISAFDKAKPRKNNNPPMNTQIAKLPHGPDQLPLYINNALKEITSIVAPFMQSEKPALMRMLKLNMKYVMQNKDMRFLECWKTHEGQQSIIDALDEAFSLGATLPAMGSIVPFGGVVEFIPAVEAFEFALTTGKTAPFVQIKIDPIYSNQPYECFENEENGNFEFRFTSLMIPQGDIAGVIVRAKDANGVKTGRIYSAENLLKKAEHHSKSYRAYLLDMRTYEFARSEGRTELDNNGREFFIKTIYKKDADKYFEQDVEIFKAAEKSKTLKGTGKNQYAEKEMPKKDGGTWTKKVYRSQIENPGTEQKKIYPDELQNPYDGPDRPEMLRKTAGKSFFSPFIKIRNSVAAMDEIRESGNDDIDSMLDMSLGKAMDNMEMDVSREKDQRPIKETEKEDIQDADFEVVDKDVEEDVKEEKKDPDDGELF